MSVLKTLFGNKALKKEKEIVQRILGNGHLIFLENNKVKYTSPEGKVEEITIDEMAMKFIDAAGGLDKVQAIGLTPEDFKGVILKERK